MSWSEDSLHRWMQRRLAPRSVVGRFGSDAAVLRRLAGRVAVCVDQTLEGVHVPVGAPAAQIGRKAADRALSDLAACAARPRALVLALALPRGLAEARARQLVSAVARRAEQFGAELVAGDTSATTGPLALSVTAIGEVSASGTPPGRERARPGQAVLVTGPTGGSGLGRHLRIEPRVAAGRWLHDRGATAMIDVSDGLAVDLARVARLSGVRIELEQVPVHVDAKRAARASGESPVWHALHDGEDHELVATLPARVARTVVERGRRRFPGLRAVGRVRAGTGLWIPAPGEKGGALVPWSDDGGWVHGG